MLAWLQGYIGKKILQYLGVTWVEPRGHTHRLALVLAESRAVLVSECATETVSLWDHAAGSVSVSAGASFVHTLQAIDVKTATHQKSHELVEVSSAKASPFQKQQLVNPLLLKNWRSQPYLAAVVNPQRHDYKERGKTQKRQVIGWGFSGNGNRVLYEQEHGQIGLLTTTW